MKRRGYIAVILIAFFFLSFRWFLPPKLPILTVTIEICWKTTYQPSFITISAFLSKDYHSSIYCNASCYGYGIYMLLIVLLLLTLITLINSSLHWIYCKVFFFRSNFCTLSIFIHNQFDILILVTRLFLVDFYQPYVLYCYVY